MFCVGGSAGVSSSGGRPARGVCLAVGQPSVTGTMKMRQKQATARCNWTLVPANKYRIKRGTWDRKGLLAQILTYRRGSRGLAGTPTSAGYSNLIKTGCPSLADSSAASRIARCLSSRLAPSLIMSWLRSASSIGVPGPAQVTWMDMGV